MTDHEWLVEFVAPMLGKKNDSAIDKLHEEIDDFEDEIIERQEQIKKLEIEATKLRRENYFLSLLYSDEVKAALAKEARI